MIMSVTDIQTTRRGYLLRNAGDGSCPRAAGHGRFRLLRCVPALDARTHPYVAGALSAARLACAVTVLVSSNPAAPLADLADYVVVADTGPEAIAGSTRLKAATAQSSC
jgi:hypothetical protein